MQQYPKNPGVVTIQTAWIYVRKGNNNELFLHNFTIASPTSWRQNLEANDEAGSGHQPQILRNCSIGIWKSNFVNTVSNVILFLKHIQSKTGKGVRRFLERIQLGWLKSYRYLGCFCKCQMPSSSPEVSQFCHLYHLVELLQLLEEYKQTYSLTASECAFQLLLGWKSP